MIGFEGEQVGVVRTRDALKRAIREGRDLVEISGNAKPPVCKIVDYGKYKYEQRKQIKNAKKNATVVKVKEVKYHANTEEHDYQTKLRHAVKFLDAGNRVKCSLYFRGRENAHNELGFDLFNRVIEDLKEYGYAEQKPKLNGKNLSMLISPHKAN